MTAVVAMIMHGDCLKYPPNVRVVTLVSREHPVPKGLLPGGYRADVEIAILPDGVKCGPRVIKSSGSLTPDTIAVREAARAFNASAPASGIRPVGTYLYHVHFTPP